MPSNFMPGPPGCRPPFSGEGFASPRLLSGVTAWLSTSIAPAPSGSSSAGFGRGVFSIFIFGTPCTAWSVTTRRREQHRRSGLRALEVTLRLIREARRVGTSWTLENPWGSALFKQAGVQTVLRQPDVSLVRIDVCEYGMHFQKATGVMGTLPQLSSLGRRCCGNHYHEHLQGTVHTDSGVAWRTSLAGAYAPPLCRAWAGLVSAVAPTCARRAAHELPDSDWWSHRLCTAAGVDVSECRIPRLRCPDGCPREWPLGASQWGEQRRWIAARGCC